jgi:hypothetical protein
MTKEEFYQLVKQWSHDTCYLSYHDTSHICYVQALQAGAEVIPWALERLKDSIGHDCGDTYDHDNSPWFTAILIGELTDHEWATNIPEADFHEEYAGRLDKIRESILQWGQDKGLIKLS